MRNVEKVKKYELSITEETPTLFAQKSPQALHSDLGPDGPRRIIGVDFELMPQCVHLVQGLYATHVDFFGQTR